VIKFLVSCGEEWQALLNKQVTEG